MFRQRGGGWIILGSLFVALMLTAMPLPVWATAWRPAWVSMVLIYWCMATPERVGITAGWLLGLFVDVLKGTLLGQHAAAFALIAYITVRNHRQVRVFPLVQQALYVGSMVAIIAVLTLWIRGVAGLPAQPSVYWLPVLTSTLLWPWLFVVLRDLRRKSRSGQVG